MGPDTFFTKLRRPKSTRRSTVSRFKMPLGLAWSRAGPLFVPNASLRTSGFCMAHWCCWADWPCQCCDGCREREQAVRLFFLHVEKTGGSAIECATVELARRGLLIAMGHTMHRHVKACQSRCGKAPVALSVRNPVRAAQYSPAHTRCALTRPDAEPLLTCVLGVPDMDRLMQYTYYESEFKVCAAMICVASPRSARPHYASPCMRSTSTQGRAHLPVAARPARLQALRAGIPKPAGVRFPSPP